MTAAVLTPQAAAAFLGVNPRCDAAAVQAAFRRAVKRGHPDRVGGDGSAVRAAIAARDALTGAFPPLPKAAPAPEPPRSPTLEIGAALASRGGAVWLTGRDGRRVWGRFPPGLRDGMRVRVGGTVRTVAVRTARPSTREPGRRADGLGLAA